MFLKMALLAMSMLFGGLGLLQVSVALESYLLLTVGLLLTTVGILQLTDRRRATVV